MQPNEVRQFIQEVFFNILENPIATDEIYEQYFSRNYIQYVDGKKLNYDAFVLHIKTLKATMKSIKISFKHMIVEGDQISTIHIVDAIKNNNEIIKVQVNALMQIKNNKIILCDELTHLIHGKKSDKDLGSRH